MAALCHPSAVVCPTSDPAPLDLLLDMIRKQKLDIYDIPIATVTGQYLDYLHLMQEMNVDLASEFLLMAAQLIYIKSRTLLPPDPDGMDTEAEDPRAELVRRLLEYEKFKNAAQMLYQKEMVEKVSWNNAGEVPFEEGEIESQVTVGLYDLLLAFRDVIKRAETRPMMQVDREEFSIEQMMGYLFDRIVSSKHTVTLTEILPAINSKRGLIVAFLALLELTRRKIHGHTETRIFGLPPLRLLAGFAKDPLADRHDQPRLLGDRDEIARLDRLAARTVPAQQRLRADDLLRRHLDHGLIVQGELAALDRVAEAVLERHPLHRAGVHRRREELDQIRAGLLRAIHRVIGVLE